MGSLVFFFSHYLFDVYPDFFSTSAKSECPLILSEISLGMLQHPNYKELAWPNAQSRIRFDIIIKSCQWEHLVLLREGVMGDILQADSAGKLPSRLKNKKKKIIKSSCLPGIWTLIINLIIILTIILISFWYQEFNVWLSNWPYICVSRAAGGKKNRF